MIAQYGRYPHDARGSNLRLRETSNAAAYGPFIARVITGLIFMSEALQKFFTPEATGAGRFAKIGFSNPEFWANFVGGFEIVCALLLLIGYFTRLAAMPLLAIMGVAFVTTKWPTLVNKGFWTFAHDFRTDFAMILLLSYLFACGGGVLSLSHFLSRNRDIE